MAISTGSIQRLPQYSMSDGYKSPGYLSPSLKKIFGSSILKVHVAASCVVDTAEGSNGLKATLIQAARLFRRELPNLRFSA
jgi:hypothetical protein